MSSHDHEERISRLEDTAARQERMIDELHEWNAEEWKLNSEIVATLRRMDNNTQSLNKPVNLLVEFIVRPCPPARIPMTISTQ